MMKSEENESAKSTWNEFLVGKPRRIASVVGMEMLPWGGGQGGGSGVGSCL